MEEVGREWVVLVDESDREIGRMEKMEAHQKGLLHRAFSVFIFNSRNELLLQQRACSKYHSGGLWTNTCCSHPRPGESIREAASRRLMEEMGMTCELEPSFSFIYKKALDKGLTEHEYDHVLTGYSDELPNINPEEASGFRYADLPTISREIQTDPDAYTEWFKICFEQVRLHSGL